MVGKVHFWEAIPDNLDYRIARDEIHMLGFDHAWLTGGKSMAGFCDDDWTAHLERRNLLERYRADLKRRGGAVGLAEATFLDDEDTVDHQTLRHGVEFLEFARERSPFFLWLSFCNPHFPFDPTQEFLQASESTQFPDLDAGDRRDLRAHRVAYAALMSQLDSYVGAFVDAIDRTGLANQTLVVFTADHGELLGEHGRFGKCYHEDGSVRVPFIARWPGRIEPERYCSAVEITDSVATFLEAAGIADPSVSLHETPSQSLLELWNGTPLRRKYAFFENGYQFNRPFVGIVNSEWKYVLFPDDGSELLFDRKKDPMEETNAVGRNPAQTSEMRRITLRRMSATPPPYPAMWVKEKTTGIPSTGEHHGPGNRNACLSSFE